MRAEQYKTQGKKGRAWFATNVSGRGLGFMGSGASLGEGAKSILSQVGISPKIETLKDEDVRKQLIEQRIGQRDITEGLGKGKNKFTRWVKTRNELRTLSLTEDDVKGLSKDDKKAVAENVYDLMLKYDADPSKFTPEDVAALGKVEKAVSSDIAKIALKNITDPTDINQARRALAMGYESIADTIKEGLPENIEKLTKSVLTIEKESLRNPSLLSKANLGKLSKLKDGVKGLKEKVADQIVDSIAGMGDKVVLKLSNSDLNRFSQEGSRSQQEKISNAIERLRDNTGSLTDAADIQTLSRIEAKTEALKKKNDWFKEEQPLQPQQSPVLDQYGRPLNRS
jgi:uncharacterized protein YkvS